MPRGSPTSPNFYTLSQDKGAALLSCITIAPLMVRSLLARTNLITQAQRAGFRHVQLHTGQDLDPVTNTRAVPVYYTASYTFNSVEGIWRRVGDPTIKQKAAPVVTSSGMAAIALAVITLASAEENITTAQSSLRGLYSKTYQQVKATFKKYRIDVAFVATLNSENFELMINENTKSLFVETIANSDTTLVDIKAWPILGARNDHRGNYHRFWFLFVLSWFPFLIGVSGNFDWRKPDKYPSINDPASAYNQMNLAEAFHRLLCACAGRSRSSCVTWARASAQ
ncbi:Cys/Met metabolism PLP-dependent enzyme-domain-containing protein [Mycena vulgaris]|nr:Cys/Met metabolism PLP-dependent enzyme-domain-containing protein [Mycena vulgaris]